MVDAPAAALLGAAGLHAGFQLTVTALVYPALARVHASGWTAAHDRHSRAITPLVGLVYLLLLTAGVWAMAALPLTAGLVTSALGAGLALGTTAVVAAPLHGRLGREGPAPALVRRLLVADRVRCASALLCLAGAALVCLRP
ncbi:hypothetical protein GCM10027517_09540 [Phycicoccus ginsengisoli]